MLVRREHVVVITDVMCPHCVGFHNMQCCVCANTRWVDFGRAFALGAWAWDRDGCDCGTCLRLRDERARLT